MPTYSYACTECGHRFDAVQAFSDDALTTCPQCGGRLRKIFGNVGVVFKGSGFYRNDARGSSTSSDSSAKPSAEKSGSGGTGSSDGGSSKPKDSSTASSGSSGGSGGDSKGSTGSGSKPASS